MRSGNLERYSETEKMKIAVCLHNVEDSHISTAISSPAYSLGIAIEKIKIPGITVSRIRTFVFVEQAQIVNKGV